METMSDRIALVVQKSGLKKVEFARKINVSQSHISRLVSGETAPSDRTIADICRVCGVDEIWLRTGTGEMFAPKTRREELEEIFHHCEIGTDAKARLIRAMAQLPDSAAEAFLAYVEALVKALSEE